MKKTYLILAIICVTTNIIAQSTAVSSGVARLNQINRGSGLIPVFNLRNADIKGSKFFNDTYTDGEIWLTNNRHYGKEYKYKFDEENNTVQIQYKDGKELQLMTYEVEIFKLYIDSSTITYFKAEVPNEKGIHRLFQVLFVGKRYTLLKLPSKKLVKNDNSGGYSSAESSREYIPTHRYFLQIDEKPFKEIKMTKRSLLKSMPHKKAALKELFEFHKGDIMDYEIAELLEETEPKN